jgi:hypothetical protein
MESMFWGDFNSDFLPHVNGEEGTASIGEFGVAK